MHTNSGCFSSAILLCTNTKADFIRLRFFSLQTEPFSREPLAFLSRLSQIATRRLNPEYRNESNLTLLSEAFEVSNWFNHMTLTSEAA